MEFSSFRPEDVAQEFYTQLKKGRKRRFTALPENLEKTFYLRQHPKSVWEARRRYGEIFFRFQQKEVHVKQTRGEQLYQIHLGSAHPSLVHSINDHPHNLVPETCQTLSRDTTRQRNRTTFINIYTTGPAVLRNNSVRQGNKLGLPFCRRDLPNIRRFHMGIY